MAPATRLQDGLERQRVEAVRSVYRNGRSKDWLKFKRSVRKEDWGKMNQDKINIRGPKEDGTYVIEFEKANGEMFSISVPASEAAILRYFQAKMPQGIVVPERSQEHSDR